MEELDGIAREHRVALVRGYSDESFVDDAPRFRPIAGGVGEVASPDERFNPDVVAQPDAERIFHEAPEITLAQIFAGLALERRHAPLALSPVTIALVVVVDLREAIRQPANLSLGPVNFQVGETVEHAGKGELDRRERIVAGEAHQQAHRIAAWRRALGYLAVMIDRALPGKSCRAAVGMRSYRHIEIDRGGPEAVVFGKGEAFAIGKFVETDAFIAGAGAIF